MNVDSRFPHRLSSNLIFHSNEATYPSLALRRYSPKTIVFMICVLYCNQLYATLCFHEKVTTNIAVYSREEIKINKG